MGWMGIGQTRRMRCSRGEGFRTWCATPASLIVCCTASNTLYRYQYFRHCKVSHSESDGAAWYFAHIPTYSMYSNGLSEVMLGKSLKKLNVPRADLVILTKVCQPVRAGSVGGKRPPGTAEALDNAGYVNQRGLSRKHIFDSVQDSLKRLDTDYIDVLQCHSEQTISKVRDAAAKLLCICKGSTHILRSRK